MEPVDLPVPPLCAASNETVIRRGERVVVELIGGRKLIGKLVRFDADKGCIAMVPDDGDRQKILGMHEIRLMRVPQPRRWIRDDDAFLSQGKGVRVVSEPLEFDIEFSDQSSINGVTFGFRNGRHGMHLFPAQDREQYTHLFVPNNAIARHRIGKHLAQESAKDTSHRDVAMICLEQPDGPSSSSNGANPALSPGPHTTPPQRGVTDKQEGAAAARQTAEPTVSDDEAAAFLRTLITGAVEAESSALHFECTPQRGARIRLRKQGELVAHGVITAERWPRFLAQLKTRCHIEPTMHSICAGKLDEALLPSSMDGHVHFISTADGEDVVIRLAPRDAVPALGDMGLGAAHLKRLDQLALAGGLLLLTGADIERLLHAVLLHLHQGHKKIWALGDIHAPSDVIRLVRDASDAADAMTSLIEADPDIIAIARLSDTALARRVTAGALEGLHTVAGLAAWSAGAAVERFINMGVPRHELADALTAVLAQRQAKRLCPHCKRRYPATADEVRTLLHEYHEAVSAGEMPADVIMLRDKTLRAWHANWAEGGQLFLYRATGCAQCQKTGYAGRVALYELLELSSPVRKALLEGADAPAITRAAVDAGMKTLRQDGIEKALQGHLDIVQVRGVCAR